MRGKKRGQKKVFSTPTTHEAMPPRTSMLVMRTCGPLLLKSHVRRLGILWPEKTPILTPAGVWMFEDGTSVSMSDVLGNRRFDCDYPIYVKYLKHYMWMSELRFFKHKPALYGAGKADV